MRRRCDMAQILQFRSRHALEAQHNRKKNRIERRNDPEFANLLQLATGLPHWLPGHEEDCGLIHPGISELGFRQHVRRFKPPENLQIPFLNVWEHIPVIVIRRRLLLIAQGRMFHEYLEEYHESNVHAPVRDAADHAFFTYCLHKNGHPDVAGYLNAVAEFGAKAYRLHSRLSPQRSSLSYDMATVFRYAGNEVRKVLVPS